MSNLGAKPMVIQLPIGAEEHFAGVIDLVENRAAVWNGEELGASFDYLPIPEEYVEKVGSGILLVTPCHARSLDNICICRGEEEEDNGKKMDGEEDW